MHGTIGARFSTDAQARSFRLLSSELAGTHARRTTPRISAYLAWPWGKFPDTAWFPGFHLRIGKTARVEWSSTISHPYAVLVFGPWLIWLVHLEAVERGDRYLLVAKPGTHHMGKGKARLVPHIQERQPHFLYYHRAT